VIHILADGEDMARRGRRRDPNVKRRQTTVAGRMPDADHGTTQLQLRRAEAVGAAVWRVEDGRVFTDLDPALSVSQLGVLLARGAIDRRRFEAGERYQALAWAAFGRPFARAVDVARPRGDGPMGALPEARDGDDRRRTGARRALARADAHLATFSGAALQAVKRACQFDQPVSGESIGPLIDGLAALSKWWGL
jgi:hypothetical protein